MGHEITFYKIKSILITGNKSSDLKAYNRVGGKFN